MTTAAVQHKGYKGIGMEGAIARWYDRTTRKDYDEFERLATRIAALVPANGSILEVAPGPGFLSIELARRAGLHVTALDISESFIRIARQNAQAAGVNADFRLGNASAMPFAGDSFDFLVCRAAFKNFSEPVKALNEMFRVLRPGGHALIIDLSSDVPMDRINVYIKRMRMNYWSAWMTRFTFRFMLLKRAYSAGQLREMLAQTRFSHTNLQQEKLGYELWMTK